MTARARDLPLSALLAEQRRSHGSGRLLENLGDGYLYRENPFFRRIRVAARRRSIRFTLTDPGDYFAFPLVALDTVLRTRQVPYRANYSALCAFDRSRPGFFTLADLRLNRPLPNYILHESAHAVAFHELFGRPDDVSAALSNPKKIVHVLLGEAYAMTAEYLAACAVDGVLHDWFFSINSYRHRTPAKKAIGEFIAEIGLPLVTWLLLIAFLENNFFVERLSVSVLDRALAAFPGPRAPRLTPTTRARLARALSSLMVMDPEFRENTARLFLTMHGYSRNIRHILRDDPLTLLEADSALPPALERLIAILCDDH